MSLLPLVGNSSTTAYAIAVVSLYLVDTGSYFAILALF